MGRLCITVVRGKRCSERQNGHCNILVDVESAVAFDAFCFCLSGWFMHRINGAWGLFLSRHDVLRRLLIV